MLILLRWKLPPGQLCLSKAWPGPILPNWKVCGMCNEVVPLAIVLLEDHLSAEHISQSGRLAHFNPRGPKTATSVAWRFEAAISVNLISLIS